MVKVAPDAPSSSTGTCFVSAWSWENNCFFLAGAALRTSGPPFSHDCTDASDLKASLRASSASLVSPTTVRTPLLPAIFMRLEDG